MNLNHPDKIVRVDVLGKQTAISLLRPEEIFSTSVAGGPGRGVGLTMPQLIKITFRRPGARSVSLAGDFNGWDVAAHPMSYDPERQEWSITLALEPGRYEYKFFVDGHDWWNDPNAPKVPNVWGSENSYVDVE